MNDFFSFIFVSSLACLLLYFVNVVGVFLFIKWDMTHKKVIGEDGRIQGYFARADFWNEDVKDFLKYEYYITRKEWAQIKIAYFKSVIFLGAPADYMSEELEGIICGWCKVPNFYKRVS